jgi:hypothetical protein
MKAKTVFLFFVAVAVSACQSETQEGNDSNDIDITEADSDPDLAGEDSGETSDDLEGEVDDPDGIVNNGSEAEECQVDEDCDPNEYTRLVSLNPIVCARYQNAGPRRCTECVEHADCPSYSCNVVQCDIIICESDEYCNGLDMSDGSFDIFTTDNELKCIQPRAGGDFVCSECQQDSDCPSGVCRAQQICARP